VAGPRSILVVKPSSLGDVVHALPAVARLREACPTAEIAWLIHPAFAPLLEDNPDIDRVLPFPREQFRGPHGLVRFGKWLHHFTPRDWDWVVDLQGLLRSALIGLAARPGRLIGSSHAREGATWFYDQIVPVTDQHAVSQNLAVIEAATQSRGSHAIRFPLPQRIPPVTGTIDVVLHPFARGTGKSLPVDGVLQLVQALAPARVLLVGRTEIPLPPLPGHTENWINRTSLPELIGILRHAKVVISVDSGPMHLAAAVCPKVIAIHTWSDPAKVGPWPLDAVVWKNGKWGNRLTLGGNTPGRLPSKQDLVQIAGRASEWLSPGDITG